MMSRCGSGFSSSLVIDREGSTIYLDHVKERAMSSQLEQDLKTLAHDIRSPLTALKLNVLDLSSCPDQNNLIAKCLEALEGLVKKIPDVISSCESPATSAPGAILKELKPRFEFTAMRHKLDISLWLAPKTRDALAPIDSLEFERTITNIVNNACEASPEGGLVSLVATTCEDELIITIKDQGRGIPRSLLDQVLLPGMTFGKAHGQGLGLAQAKSTIEKAGGELCVDSVVNEGTTVTIRLPIVMSRNEQTLSPKFVLCA
jgi:two-component system, sporulation sensor kinase D